MKIQIVNPFGAEKFSVFRNKQGKRERKMGFGIT